MIVFTTNITAGRAFLEGIDMESRFFRGCESTIGFEEIGNGGANFAKDITVRSSTGGLQMPRPGFAKRASSVGAKLGATNEEGILVECSQETVRHE
jgi:hypothetical protein